MVFAECVLDIGIYMYIYFMYRLQLFIFEITDICLMGRSLCDWLCFTHQLCFTKALSFLELVMLAQLFSICSIFSWQQAQKPWAKRLAKVVDAKKKYHTACKLEKSATNQENNARGDNAVSGEQVGVPGAYVNGVKSRRVIIVMWCSRIDSLIVCMFYV